MYVRNDMVRENVEPSQLSVLSSGISQDNTSLHFWKV